MRRAAAYALALLVLANAGLAAASPSPAAREDAARPILLMLHGGGFIFDDASRMREARRIAVGLGFDPVFVDYPNFDLRGAIEAATAAARDQRARGRAIYAYGESAGGTLAGLLAQAGLVDAAVGYSPIANMRRYAAQLEDPALYTALIEADRRLLLRTSPGIHDSDRPILVIAADGDRGYFRDAIEKWAERDRDVTLRSVKGAHIGEGEPAVHRRNARDAMRWLMRGAKPYYTS